MEKEYILRSGQKIGLESLQQHEREHIGMLEECINSCTNHNGEDYFYVVHKAFEPISIDGNTRQLERVFNSPHYMIVEDLVDRYYDKCFTT